MKKALLCDANFCVLPLVKSIKNHNYYLSVIGSRLDDPAHCIADESIGINYSDIDLLLKEVSKKDYNYIVPGCNDQAYISSAYIAHKLGLSGFDDIDTILTMHHKDKFRAFATEKNYPIPNSIYSLDEVDEVKFPLLVKPIDSFSGKGINKALNIEELSRFWHEAKSFSKSGLVIAEEFIDGKLYSHSAFIKNGKIIVDFFVNEFCTVYPYQVNSSYVSTKLNKHIKEGMRTWCEKFASDLSLCDGLIHTQFISNNEKFYLIEVARRCPGDLYSKLIEKTTGIDYAKLYSMPFLDIELPDKVFKTEKKYIARHTVSSSKESIFISSHINICSKDIENVQLKNSGEYMREAPYGKSGIYFIEFFSKDEMEKYTESLKDFVTIETLNLKEIES